MLAHTTLASAVPHPARSFAFAAQIECPFCRWQALNASPSYCAAQATVVGRLLEHMEEVHADLRGGEGRLAG